MKLTSQPFLPTKPSNPFFLAPLFSYSYKSPFPARRRNWTFLFSYLQIPFRATPFVSHRSDPPGVWGSHSLYRAVLRELVSPLECAFTPNRAASPLESAFTKKTGVGGMPPADFRTADHPCTATAHTTNVPTFPHNAKIHPTPL